ncbi:MAG TPA: efflux RND transporter periplasmic adaptor subunit [Chitinophagaceae bacterium]|nr:efflux RND transporter periplasmic adaptor subunit [Chitinophagaceae bacterium]
MKRYIKLVSAVALLCIGFLSACNDQSKEAAEAVQYSCPMHPDIIRDEPGRCPVCGMELQPIEKQIGLDNKADTLDDRSSASGYTCPMHPQVKSDTAGSCPVCGMQLEKIKAPGESRVVSLNTLLKPANQQVVAAVPMVHMQQRGEDIELATYGFISYDPRYKGTIAANFSGRIDKLYVKYRYQYVHKGQKIMDIYSPELLTAQENLLFVLRNDSGNGPLLEAAKQKLLLLGMSRDQLNQIIQTEKTQYLTTVYSKYSGHIHESGMMANADKNDPPLMKDVALVTQGLSLKEGMYVQKGQEVFSVYNADRAWALLNIFAGQSTLVKKGDKVRIVPETNPSKDFRATINYIEPYFEKGSKTQTVRVYFDNSKMQLPIGSQVKATIFAGDRYANWLPEEAVLSLGIDKVVFVREQESFRARKVETGIVSKHLIQILGGLDKSEAVAANAQYLIDSESFIRTN